MRKWGNEEEERKERRRGKDEVMEKKMEII